MKTTIEGNELVVRVPMDAVPQLSSTGRSHVLFSTRGWAKATVGERAISVSMTVVEPLRKRTPARDNEPAYDGGGES